MRWRVLPGLAPVFACLLAACGTRGFQVPEGPGVPRADAAALFAEASAGCRSLRTMTAELALSGQIGDESVRRRLQVGLQSPGSVRLEAPAPFGAPVFLLAASEERGSLLFPREREVVLDAPVRDLLRSIAGMELRADELLALVSGCVAPQATPRPTGREYPGGWVAVDLDGSDGRQAVAWLQRLGDQWRVAVGERPELLVEYAQYAPGPNGTPRELRVRTRGDTTAVDLTVVVAQVEMNVPLPEEAFSLVIPADAVPVTIDELQGRALSGDE